MFAPGAHSDTAASGGAPASYAAATPSSFASAAAADREIEMSADDYARARVSAPALRAALEKSSLFHRPPRGALGMHDAVVERRLHRLERGAVPMLDQATLLGVSGAALSLFWTLLMVR